MGRMDVFVGVASIPSREKSLEKVMERLLPQAHQIGVYLNGYDAVPGFLRRRRILVARSQDHGDVRDNGKFFFLNQSSARYYATVDDDLLYPHDYLQRLVACQREAGQRAAVGVHGAIYPSPIVDLFEPRYLIHFEDPSAHAVPVHLLGTGTTLFDQADWNLEFGEFGAPGMADVWFAAAAARRQASLFVTKRVRNWVSAFDDRTKGSPGALFHEGLHDSTQQVAVLKEAASPSGSFVDLIQTLLISPTFSDELSLNQTLELDRIRTQLGYAPLSDDESEESEDLLRSQRRDWPASGVLTAAEVESVGRLVVDVLADRLAPRTLHEVLEVIERLGTLSDTYPRRWAMAPAALRTDTGAARGERLKATLMEKAMHRADPSEARWLWTSSHGRADVSLQLALQAERASIHTGFERLPAFADLAREKPIAASARLFEYFEAVDWLREPDIAALKKAFRSSYKSLDVQMLVCIAAARSGDRDFAVRTMRRLRRQWPWDGDVRLLEAALSGFAAGSTPEALAPVFEVLDEAIGEQGLSPYRHFLRHADGAGHWIHRLESTIAAGQSVPSVKPTISVLMTTYNDADTIGGAMGSILASSGVDLELIVVDDASTDDTPEQIRRVDDARVKVIRNHVNVGPYVSRNRGLELARGEFVAIADGDDWSHPQRLEYQASILRDSRHLIGCKVAHLRVRPDGTLDLENHFRFVGDGPVSLVFRRWLVDHIGGFDHVRTRGDIEFLRRITARFGSDALTSFSTPLLLATSSPTSNSKRFREESLNMYRAASRTWHQRHALTDALFVPLSGSRAPFLAPYDLLARRQSIDEPGRVVVTDQQAK